MMPDDAVQVIFNPHVTVAMACVLFGLVFAAVQLMINMAPKPRRQWPPDEPPPPTFPQF